MKRMMFFFATALLVLLAFTPTVIAAKDWSIKTGDWRFALFPDSVAQGLRPGDNLDILGRYNVINGLGIKTQVIIPPGVNIFTDAGITIGKGVKFQARGVVIHGPLAPETKARRGQAEPMGEDNDRVAGFYIVGADVEFDSCVVDGFGRNPFRNMDGGQLRVAHSRLINGAISVPYLGNPDPNSRLRRTESVYNNLVGENSYFSIEIGDGAFFTDTSSVMAAPSIIGSEEKIPKGRAVFIGTKGLRFVPYVQDFVNRALRMGAIIIADEKPLLVGDFDLSGLVDFDDFFAFAAAFGQPATGDNAKFDLAPNGQIDFDDFFVFAANFGTKAGKPIGMLGNNFPNPFNPVTTIQYALAEDAPVELRIYNMLGQVVRTLVNERQTIGTYSIRWDGKDDSGLPAASGVYISRLHAGQFSHTRKMVLLK